MAEKKRPGALAGAAEAGCLQAATFGPRYIARPEAQRHHGDAFALRFARLRRLGLAPGPAALVAGLAWGAPDG